MIGKKRLVTLAGLAALALGDVALVSAPAHADAATISCTGWSYTTYSPGLTNTVRPTTVTVAGRRTPSTRTAPPAAAWRSAPAPRPASAT